MNVRGFNSGTTLSTLNSLQRTGKAIARSLERLSSGKRVNSPSDDPAAFALGVNLDSQIRGTHQGLLEINKAQGLLQTTASALQAQLEIIQKMRELAIQGAQGTLSSGVRASLNEELKQLRAELERIAETTDFNGIKPLKTGVDGLTIQVGASPSDSIKLQGTSSLESDLFRKTIGTGIFQTRKTYGSGSGDYNIHTADLNGDGHLDLVTEDANDSTLSILLGKGDGTFSQRITYAGGGGRLTVGDLNNDGITDIVTATWEILIGNGDGTFKPRRTYVSTGYNDPEVADLNNDGKLDLLGAAVGHIDISFGNGDGTFGPIVTVGTAGTTNHSAKTGDLNGDGNLDIIVTDYLSGVGSILLGNGNGTFKAATALPSLGVHTDSSIADLNRDGKMDVITWSYNSFGYSIMLGNGDGTLQSGSFVSTPGFTFTGKIHDVNSDGIEDLILGQAGANSIAVAIGNGNGTFQTIRTFASSNAQAATVVGDFNEDGAIDIAASDYLDSTISVFMNNTQSVTAISDIQVNTAQSAKDLLGILDNAMTKILENSNQVGAQISRLEITSNTQSLLSENLSEARSKSLDADLAEETTELVRNQILQQAQIAALTQSNLMAQTVLKILESLK